MRQPLLKSSSHASPAHKMNRPSNLTEKFVVSADGSKIFASAVGNPEKPALVFVHGYALTSAVFNDIFSNPWNSKDFYLVRDSYRLDVVV